MQLTAVMIRFIVKVLLNSIFANILIKNIFLENVHNCRPSHFKLSIYLDSPINLDYDLRCGKK